MPNGEMNVENNETALPTFMKKIKKVLMVVAIGISAEEEEEKNIESLSRVVVHRNCMEMASCAN